MKNQASSKKAVTICINILLLTMSVYSQENTNTPLHLAYEIHDDSLKIKWAPANAETWLWGTKYGYTLTMHSIEEVDSSYNFETSVIDSMVMPYDQTQFTTLFKSHPDSNLLMVQAQSIYGEWELKNQDKNPALFYMQSQEFNNRYSYSILAADLSWKSALAGGLAYQMKIDTSIAHFIDIRLNHPDSTKEILGATYVHNVPLQNMKPHLSRIQENDGNVTLFWDKKIYQTYFTAYLVEKAEKVEGPYELLTKHPYVSSTINERNQNYFSYSDSLSSHFETAYYRIIGINAFGRKSQPSDPIKAIGRDRTSPIPAQIDTCYRKEVDRIQIKWSLSPSEDVAGYLVWKVRPSADTFELVSATLTSRKQNSYIDEKAIHDKYYYILQTIDTAGNTSQSSRYYFFEYDSIPPPQPQNVRGVIDTTGTVILQWDHLSVTDDLLGYKVLYANEPDHVFAAATPQYYDYNTFIDTISLDNLTHHIYYKVMAIDQNFNQSEFSEILRLEKPDTIPPLAPQIQKFSQAKGQIQLTWVPSPSSDVVRHEIEFQLDSTSEDKWLVEQEILTTDRTIKLPMPERSAVFLMRIVATDQGNNRSYSKVRRVRPFVEDQEVQLEITDFEIKEESNDFYLKWACSKCSSDTSYKVYKKKNSEVLKLLASTKNTEFRDRFVTQGDVYEYHIKAVDQNRRNAYSTSKKMSKK